MRALLAGLLLALPASALAADYPATDQAGNVYPAECRRDLSGVDVKVSRLDSATLQVGNPFMGKRLGMWMAGSRGLKDQVFIDKNLSGWKYDDALHHERCHALMFKLYPATGGQWHR